MKRLREKLQSQSGASILLALLLFLVCAMVSASILAASVSNAGKARSNRVEQQKYLTLSSAIRFVADELQKAEYTGKYKVYEWENDEGTSEEDIHYYYYIQQQQGVFTCGDLGKEEGEGTFADALIPLRNELEAIFNEQFDKLGYGAVAGLGLTYTSQTHTLKVTLPGGLKGYPYETSPGLTAYKVSDTVTVEVRLDHATCHIKLTAWLGAGSAPADKSDTMIAELVAKAGSAPKIKNADIPVGKEPEALPDPLPAGTTERTTTVTPAMQWELNWIKKGAAE